jgi:hypothetical protein
MIMGSFSLIALFKGKFGESWYFLSLNILEFKDLVEILLMA